MRLRSTALFSMLVLVGSFPCLSQQPTGPAMLEKLPPSGEAQKPAATANADATDSDSMRLAGTVARPKDGVQHPDLDKAWALYDAAVAKAAEGVRATINKQFDAAAAKGDLDAAEQWQAAIDKFEKSGELPKEAEAKAAVNAAEAAFKKASEELAKAYEAAEKLLTMAKELPAARRVRAELKSLADGLQKTRKAGGSPVGKRRLQGFLFASGDDSYAMYVNDKLVATGGLEVKPAAIVVSVGDIITVKSTNAAWAHGFLAILVFEKEKKQIVTNSTAWQSYVPKDPAKWFEVSGITDVKAAVRGLPNDVAPALAKVVTADAESIWSSESKEVAYLTLKVEENSFLPLQAVPVWPSKP